MEEIVARLQAIRAHEESKRVARAESEAKKARAEYEAECKRVADAEAASEAARAEGRAKYEAKMKAESDKRKEALEKATAIRLAKEKKEEEERVALLKSAFESSHRRQTHPEPSHGKTAHLASRKC
jgi:hypothetical protein